MRKYNILLRSIPLLLLLIACKKEYNTNIYTDYQFLEGRWKRVSSNFSDYDDMVVRVGADAKSGIIEVVPRNDPNNIFPKGSVKWRNIRRESNNSFVCEDLGEPGFLSDNTRDALMVCVSEDSLRVAVRGNGSWQVWLRE